MASRYGPKARQKVARAMHERKRGTLKSGSGRTVRSRKQAIAIGLSEARREGGKAPSRSSSKKTGKKSSSRKTGSSRKSSSRKTGSSKKSSSRRTRR